jgi:hypothetical protein
MESKLHKKGEKKNHKRKIKNTTLKYHKKKTSQTLTFFKSQRTITLKTTTSINNLTNKIKHKLKQKQKKEESKPRGKKTKFQTFHSDPTIFGKAFEVFECRFGLKVS